MIYVSFFDLLVFSNIFIDNGLFESEYKSNKSNTLIFCIENYEYKNNW